MTELDKTAAEMQKDLSEIITLSTEFLGIAKELGFEVDQGLAESTLEFTVHKGSRRIAWRVDCDFLSNGPSFGFSWHSTPEYNAETGNDGYVFDLLVTDPLSQKPPEITKRWQEVPFEERDVSVPPMVDACIANASDAYWNRRTYRAIFKALLKFEEN